MLRIGSAAVDITPPLGTRLAGQIYDRLAEEIHDPLTARALVLDDGATWVAVVACDLIAHKRSTVLKVRELVAAQTNLPAENVLITASHTHTGPRVTDLLPLPSDSAYLALLPRQIAGAVTLAAHARQPGQVGVGSGLEESASHNRRFVRKDGTAEMNPPKDDPSFIGPEGPGDPEVGVLWARDDAGRLLGAIVNYTSHPTVVSAERAVSADYPGYLVRALEAVKGGPAKVLFVNGALGNVCPTDVSDLPHREYGWGWAERVGNVIAGEALRVLEKTEPLADPRIRVASRLVDLAIRPIDDEQVAAARAVASQDEIVYRRGLLATEEGKAYVEQVYARDVLRLAEERRQLPTAVAEVQAIAIGDAAFVGIPGELFVEFGLEIKRRSPFQHTYVAGMANGCVGYIPTRRAFQNGGYETRLCRSSKLVREAGEVLTEAAISLLESLH